LDATVVKVGGSLALHPKKLKRLCTKLSEVSKEHKLVLVPGGGEFADVVRKVDRRFKLSAEASHRMAILGMDQYGFLLSDLTKDACIVSQLANVQKALDMHTLPIFLPSNHMLNDDPLENSWDVTSDSIAAYIASQLHIKRLILITDVDGVYSCDPKTYSDAKLIKKISVKQLQIMDERTCVDKFLPLLLSQSEIQCFVVNGFFPERIEAILEGKKIICTIII
jgi:5-(aminomethyl)-3-furanmethanol phosphate kinase